MPGSFRLWALAVGMLVLASVTGCSTLGSTSTAPASEPPPTATAPAPDTTDLDPRIVRLYTLESQLLAAQDSARVGTLLDQAMAELATLLESDPALIQRDDVRSLYQGLTAEYRRYHGYSSDPDSMVTARGSIFAVRAQLFASLDAVEQPTLRDADVPEETAAPETAIPLTVNRAVQQSIEYLQKDPDRHFNAWMRRAETYFPMVDHVLKEEGAPPELRYLAMVESGLNPRARSWAGAAGMWQFMRGTGRLYDLAVDGWVDERRDPEKATRAAARHMNDLYDQFGDWHLAMAAYNCGAGCVRRAIRRTGGDNPSYWDVYEHLPRETRGYVPMFIATTLLASNPETYGLDDAPSAPPFAYDYVSVHGSMLPLSKIAELAGTTTERIRALNPELRRNTLPPSKEMYPLRIPLGSYEQFKEAYAALPDKQKRPATTYTVRRGDTLSEIAEQFGTSTGALRRANGIRGSIIRIGQTLVVPVRSYDAAVTAQGDTADDASSPTPARVQYASTPVVQPLDPVEAAPETPAVADARDASTRGDASEASSEDRDAPPVTNASTTAPSDEPARDDGETDAPAPTTYTVKRGDTLSEIATRFSVRTRDLRRWNSLAGSRIHVGETLQLQDTGDASGGRGTVTYRVRSGDTLGEIAQQFRVSTRELRAWNGLSSSRIVVGQTLTVHPDGSAVFHVVQRGDTLGAIAESYGTTIRRLREMNDLSGSRIYPGQKLKISAN